MSRKLLLILILALATFLRLYKLSTLPPSLFSDEVDIGYQAMVFNHNHTDYFGNPFPLNFHSFSDWQPAIGIYAVSLAQSISHNPELSVRLPSAIFGLLSIFILFLITRSLIPSLLLAISPWAIHYSRTGFAVSGMMFAIFLGIYFWQQFVATKKYYNIYLSILFFCLTPYIYSTAKLYLAFIPVILFMVWRKEFLVSPIKNIILPLIFAIILLVPLAMTTIKGQAGFRFSYISIFTQPHREQITDTLRYEDIYSNNIGKVGIPTPFISFIFHNKYQLIWEKFVSNYFSSFSTNFLYLTGDTNLRQGFGGFGMLYFLDFFFIPVGIYIYFRKKTKLGTFFFWLLLLAPIPFALTRDSLSPHSTRLILMLPSLIYFASLSLKKLPLFIPVYLIFLFTFWHFYQFHYPQLSARSWNTGMKEAVLLSTGRQTPAIIYSNKAEPFLPFFFFYSRYLPTDAPTNHLHTIDNQSISGQTIDNKFYFGTINFNNLSALPKSALFVVPKSEYINIDQSKFTIVEFIQKHYIEQEEFYILKLND